MEFNEKLVLKLVEVCEKENLYGTEADLYKKLDRKIKKNRKVYI